MAGSCREAEALRRPPMQFMGGQPVPKQSPQETWKISHLRYMRQNPNGQHAHVCVKLKTRSVVAAPQETVKGWAPMEECNSPSPSPDPRRYLPLTCVLAPGPTSWVWHLCCPSNRDRLVLGSYTGGSGGNYWLNLKITWETQPI